MDSARNLRNFGRLFHLRSIDGSEIVLYEGKQLTLVECHFLSNTLLHNYELIVGKNAIIIDKNNIIRSQNVELNASRKKFFQTRVRWLELIRAMNSKIDSTLVSLDCVMEKLNDRIRLDDEETEMNQKHIVEIKQMLLKQVSILKSDSNTHLANQSTGETLYQELRRRGGCCQFLLDETDFESTSNSLSQETVSDNEA
ncbi:predicted protein [Chaetoceros tenuissimus]|uniref:Uncharacterized protein n=1 Tax=Chaetoceros tenuissimus TaxID=426638 RepID=A0AAD3CPZ2_9STRA|nr:predicted protein [Chaetoceros tenuissimus]